MVSETPLAAADPRAAAASGPHVLGLDLSLTRTGWAQHNQAGTIVPAGLDGLDRIRYISRAIVDLLSPDIQAVGIEGPSLGSTHGKAHERGGLWWRVIDRLDSMDIPVVVIPPTVLKKFATGRGNADKDTVLGATFRAFDWFCGGNDEADSLWCAAIAAELVGRPFVDIHPSRRQLLSKVSWLREPIAA